MNLDPDSAQTFIEGYRQVLLMVHSLKGMARKGTPNDRMVAARRHLAREQGLLEEALESLANRRGVRVPEPVIAAIRTLYLEQWVYLRDLKKYSIFLHPDKVVGFGVVGLTQPIREITHGPGWCFEAGVMAFDGKFICDGLLDDPMALGPQIRGEFDQAFKELKALGAFHGVPTGRWAKPVLGGSHPPLPARPKAKAAAGGAARTKSSTGSRTEASGDAAPAPSLTTPGAEGRTIPFTPLQGQYLAFIQAYATIHGNPPAERELQVFFGVTPPVVHQMILLLASKGYLHREPGMARSLKVLLPPESLPVLMRPSSSATRS